MKGLICTAALLSLASGTAFAEAPQVQRPIASAAKETLHKSTFLYAIKGEHRLQLDRISDPSGKFAGPRPVIIYSFGGGWEGGARSEPLSDSFLNELVSLGYIIIAIDYRLGIKEAKAKKELTPATTKAMYFRAIQWGVEDLYDATAYVLKHADAWNIDKTQIALIGSSAGATNSLVAEYNLANDTALARAHLPAGFRYAAVISMAGAFWLPGGDTPLSFNSKPAPIMFFHGPKDQLVTYDEHHDQAEGGFSGYGPAYYNRKYASAEYVKWFVDVIDADHSMSAIPMLEYRYEIAAFLQKAVRERQRISVHMIEHGLEPKIFQNLSKLYGKRLFTGTEADTPK